MRFLIPVIFVCLLASSRAATAAGEGADLDLLTLNTWGLPYPVAKVRRAVRFPRIQRFLQETSVDIAGLQEVWDGARHLLDLPGLRFGQRRNGDTGLALWSRLPLTDVQETVFRVSRGFDRIKHKGILRARVEVPDAGSVWVFVTHMQAGGGSANARMRATQADQLLGEISQVVGPAVVLGDFNLSAARPIDRKTGACFEAAGLLDAAAGREVHASIRALRERIAAQVETGG